MKVSVAKLATLSVLVLFLALTGCGSGTLDEPHRDTALHAEISLSTNLIRIGDPIEVHLSITHPAGEQPTWESPARGRDIIIRNTRQETTQINDRTARTSVMYNLTSLSVSNHIIGGGAISAGTETVEFPFAAIEVISTLDTNNLNETIQPKPMARWPEPGWQFNLATTLIAVALAALGAALTAWMLIRRRRLKDSQAPSAPATPPHKAALSALAALHASPHLERVEPDPFFTQVSIILRQYLEDACGLRAREQTTEEFVTTASHSPVLTNRERDLVSGFLVQCDLIKFARAGAEREAMLAGLELAERFVRDVHDRIHTEAREENGS